MENLSLEEQSPVGERLEVEEDREEQERTEGGKDHSPAVEEVEEVVEVEGVVEVEWVEAVKEDLRVLEARSLDLARLSLPVRGEMWSPVWEPVRSSAQSSPTPPVF